MTHLTNLSILAVSIGLVHCLTGPDHYLPFVAMARVGGWSIRKTLVVTVLCGTGHVLGSAALGFLGIICGLVVFRMEAAEVVRGDLASWMMLGFGLVYLAYGLRLAWRHRRINGSSEPGHECCGASEEHGHVHAHGTAHGVSADRMTPWVLFTLFLFGPCEPLIPVLMVPASQGNMWHVAWVTILFGGATIVTMTLIVAALCLTSRSLQFAWGRVWGHALAGGVVTLCGLAIKLGL